MSIDNIPHEHQNILKGLQSEDSLKVIETLENSGYRGKLLTFLS